AFAGLPTPACRAAPFHGLQPFALVRSGRVVGELWVPVVSAGAAALVAKDHLDQIPVHRAMIRALALGQLGNVEDNHSLACQAVHRKACAGLQLLAEEGPIPEPRAAAGRLEVGRSWWQNDRLRDGKLKAAVIALQGNIRTR
ncbi:hypothetical protein, partial [Mesorhizobium sp.]|uniref:hypothetical protein n=1 Tax=Mesorhizobium sp. TaxID=1871066 RepID=UPI0025CB7C5E